MLKQITLTALGLFLFFTSNFAQEVWSLERCILYAQQNNLTVKQAQYQVSNADLSVKQSVYSRLPNLNASITGGYQFGRTIDPVTNDFNNEQIGINSYSLDASVLLYNGNRINNTIKQSKLDLEAAKLDAQAASNNISLMVAASYLNILLFEEQLENARKNLEQSQQQLEQTDKLIQAGALPANDRLDFLAQIALNEQAVIEAQNQININYLGLKQLLELDPSTQMRIAQPEVEVPADANPDNFVTEEVYTAALGILPEIAAGEKRLQSAYLGEKIAQAGAFPSIRLFAGLNSNYSTLAVDPTADPTDIQFADFNEDVLIDGQPATITTTGVSSITFPKRGFFDQLNDNFGQSIGLSIQIPIYNNSINKINMERARVGALIQEVQNKQQRNQIKTDIQQAIANATAAKEAMEAAERSVEATQRAFENAQRRFDLGAINSLEFSTARNTQERAQIDYIRAKYQYIFNLKVVDFYVGNPLRINN